jgi:hypothetical protein
MAKKIVLGLDDFGHLMKGGILTSGKVEIILADIGYAAMVDELLKALTDRVVNDDQYRPGIKEVSYEQ